MNVRIVYLGLHGRAPQFRPGLSGTQRINVGLQHRRIYLQRSAPPRQAVHLRLQIHHRGAGAVLRSPAAQKAPGAKHQARHHQHNSDPLRLHYAIVSKIAPPSPWERGQGGEGTDGQARWSHRAQSSLSFRSQSRNDKDARATPTASARTSTPATTPQRTSRGTTSPSCPGATTRTATRTCPPNGPPAAPRSPSSHRSSRAPRSCL